jgi:small glutamine-rich tetratricopeptide repeat-containing protein alpha
MADKKQKLVLSVLEFLQGSIADGTVKQDDVEGLEVASASRSFLLANL